MIIAARVCPAAKLLCTRRGKPRLPLRKILLPATWCCTARTSGELFLRGMAGERFCVRNSGAHAVVEGVGDHGCEYMTGGRAIILGETGRNFAAGMSGGIAYALDETGRFPKLVNKEMVELEELNDEDREFIGRMLTKHVQYTGSVPGQHVLNDWDKMIAKFVKVMPVDYKRALAEMAKAHLPTSEDAETAPNAVVNV